MAKIIEVAFVFFLIAILVGSIPICITKEKHAGLLKAILYGSIIMLMLFAIIAIPLTIMDQSLTRLTYIWSGLVLLISLVSVFMSKRFIMEQIKKIPVKFKSLTYLDVIILLLIGLQIAVCVKYIFLHANDAYYVGMATTTLNTDRLFAFSPYTGAEIQWTNYKSHVIASLPIFWAMLARLFGVTGAFMCHSVVPVLFIPVGYILYREIGLFLFRQDDRAIRIFLVLICLCNFFIGKNYDTSYEMLSTCIWQGGAFLYNIVLPGIFYFEFNLFRKNYKKLNYCMFFMMMMIGTMTVPKSGIFLSVLAAIVLGVSFFIEKLLTRRKRMDAGINI